MLEGGVVGGGEERHPVWGGVDVGGVPTGQAEGAAPCAHFMTIAILQNRLSD